MYEQIAKQSLLQEREHSRDVVDQTNDATLNILHCGNAPFIYLIIIILTCYLCAT